MGLRKALARLAAARLHVFLVEGSGAFVLRATAEQACLSRGWRLAPSPADADALLICGPVNEALAEALGVVWDQLPRPRVRAEVSTGEDVAAALDTLVEAHASWRANRDPAPRLTTGEKIGPKLDQSGLYF